MTQEEKNLLLKLKIICKVLKYTLDDFFIKTIWSIENLFVYLHTK